MEAETKKCERDSVNCSQILTFSPATAMANELVSTKQELDESQCFFKISSAFTVLRVEANAHCIISKERSRQRHPTGKEYRG